MRWTHALAAAALVPALGGCLATKQDLKTLQTQMEADRAENNRQIAALIARTQAMLDSLSGQNARIRADVANRMLQIDRQLVQIQALSGQSQQQIRDLQQQLERRAAEARAAEAAADSTAAAVAERPAPADDAPPRNTRPPASTDRTASTDRPAATPASPPRTTPRTSPPAPRSSDGAPTADEAYDTALGAFRRGSLSTARQGFQEFLRIAPDDRRAADAQFYVGEAYTRDPDAAIAAYQRVVDRYPTSSRTPTALLRMAKLEIARGDRAQARTHLNRILRSFPRSDEADEARTQLDRLGTR